MPPKSRVRGVGKSRNNVDESNSGLLQSGNIESLHVLVQRFEQELLELKQKNNMDRTNSSTIDAAARRVRMIALLEEFSALASQEMLVSDDFRESVRGVQADLNSSLSAAASVADEPLPAVPDHAPERWSDRADKAETPGNFIERVYGFCLERLALRDIRRLDYKLYNSFMVWRSKGNKLPSGITLPTESQLNDQALRQHGFLPSAPSDPRESMRLAMVHEARLRRASKREPR